MFLGIKSLQEGGWGGTDQRENVRTWQDGLPRRMGLLGGRWEQVPSGLPRTCPGSRVLDPGSCVPVLCPRNPPVSLPPTSPVQTEDTEPWRGRVSATHNNMSAAACQTLVLSLPVCKVDGHTTSQTALKFQKQSQTASWPHTGHRQGSVRVRQRHLGAGPGATSLHHFSSPRCPRGPPTGAASGRESVFSSAVPAPLTIAGGSGQS